MTSAGPAVFASAATVIAALLCLSIAKVNGTSGLGPIGAMGVGCAAISMLTLLPALLNRAAAERRTGQLPEALRDYDAYLTQKTDNPLAYTNRGNARFENKDYAGAIADCDRAITLDAKYAYAWNNRAAAELKLTQYAKAVVDATEALRLNPQYAEAYLNRGHAREMLRQALILAEADDCYQALKLARRVMRHEEEVLGLAPVPTARQAMARPEGEARPLPATRP